MRVVVKGLLPRPAKTMRLSCDNCECVFDISRGDTKRRRASNGSTTWYELYVGCPWCGEVVDGFDW